MLVFKNQNLISHMLLFYVTFSIFQDSIKAPKNFLKWLLFLCLIKEILTFKFVFQVCGFKAPSPLLKLPSSDIVNGIGIDAMHCVFLGVVKQLVGLWFNSKHSGQRWYCGNSVDKRLLEIKPASVITRIP